MAAQVTGVSSQECNCPASLDASGSHAETCPKGIARQREFHRVAIGKLAGIAEGKRKTREQRSAASALSFLRSLGDEMAANALENLAKWKEHP